MRVFVIELAMVYPDIDWLVLELLPWMVMQSAVVGLHLGTVLTVDVGLR